MKDKIVKVSSKEENGCTGCIFLDGYDCERPANGSYEDCDNGIIYKSKKARE